MLEQRKACRAIGARGANPETLERGLATRRRLVYEPAVLGQRAPQIWSDPRVLVEAVRRVAEDQVVRPAPRGERLEDVLPADGRDPRLARRGRPAGVRSRP